MSREVQEHGPYREAGKLIERARGDLSQKEFAAKAALKQRNISNWETGHSWPRNAEDREKLRKAGVDVAALNAVVSRLKDLHLADDDDRGKAPHRSKTAKDGFLPVVGRGACGEWIDAIAADREPHGEIRTEEIPKGYRLRDKRAFWVEAVGDSMTGSGIEEGAMLLVEPRVTPKRGDHVLVYYDGQVTVKVWGETDTHVVLVPTNPKYEPLVVEKGRFSEAGGNAYRITLQKPPARPL